MTHHVIILHPFGAAFQAVAAAVALPHVANWFDHIAMTKLQKLVGYDFVFSSLSRTVGQSLSKYPRPQNDQVGSLVS